MPGFPVHHQLLELAQTNIHWVWDVMFFLQLSPNSVTPFPPWPGMTKRGRISWGPLLPASAPLTVTYQYHPVPCHLQNQTHMLDPPINWNFIVQSSTQTSFPVKASLTSPTRSLGRAGSQQETDGIFKLSNLMRVQWGDCLQSVG